MRTKHNLRKKALVREPNRRRNKPVRKPGRSPKPIRALRSTRRR